ncbi:MAG: hypothetical protein LBI27_02815 [Clostridiales bacterium]|jgi:hypothetical protein|nr:hypothetical protein [Clostridiales bacterium]
MMQQQKIAAMTKLALYDKHEGAADRAANEYFRHDYIYKKNIGTRISVGIGAVVILAIHWLRIIFVEGVGIFDLNIQTIGTETILFIVAVVALYSLIGTIQGTREYYLVQKRLQQYQGTLRFLENLENKRTEKPAEEVSQDTQKRPRPITRQESLEARREERAAQRKAREVSLRDIDASTRRTPVVREAKKDIDPLANVSARARATTRPRTVAPLTQRATRVRVSTSDRDAPLLRTPTNLDEV